MVIQAFFAVWMLWTGGASARPEITETVQQPLSIIVCARNEAENLSRNLPFILEQDHPDFELIVVNDASEDTSAEVLAAFQAQYPQLKVLTITPDEERLLPGKKYALSKAVALAKNQCLLLCDADCKPVSKHWASIMSSGLHHPKEIMAGYGAYEKKSGLLNVFIRWETVHTFIQYSSYARSGIPYMAVGRNLVCKKEMIEQAQVQDIWAAMPSGDDDLLIRLMGGKRNVGIIADPKAFTISVPKEHFGDWIAQKQRHLSTGKLYKKSVQFLLGLYGLSHGLTWILFLLLWIAGYGYLISSLMLLRCMLVWSLWGISCNALREKGLLLWLPLCDIGWAAYNLILSPYIFFKTKRQWT